MRKNFDNFENISVTLGGNLHSRYSECRDCYFALEDFVDGIAEGTPVICAVYGLRRTGKTEMMVQCIENLPAREKERSAYVSVDGTISMYDLKKCLNALVEEGIRNFFIDEITEVYDFQAYGSCLSDYYARNGCKVVIAGTDSLGIMLASYDKLYDRISFINTTHVPFSEFSRLLGGKTIDEYIQYGGTLTNSPYKTGKNRDAYLNTAIIDNILHSLENGAEGKKYWSTVASMYGEHEISSVINKMINKFSYSVMLKAINRPYKSGALHAIMEGSKVEAFQDIVKPEPIDAAVKKELEILDSEEMSKVLTPEALDEIKGYLEDLGLLVKIPEYRSLKKGIQSADLEVLTQPGMIYAHSEALLKQLTNTTEWREKYDDDVRKEFIDRTDGYVRGEIMEREIILETYNALSIDDAARERFFVSRINVTSGMRNLDYNGKPAEADLAVVDRKEGCSYLFEVKHSSISKPDEQAKHLTNRDFLDFVSENFAPVRSVAVIYTGPGMASYRINDVPVQYINVEDFLVDIHDMDRKLQRGALSSVEIDFGEKVRLDPRLRLDRQPDREIKEQEDWFDPTGQDD